MSNYATSEELTQVAKFLDHLNGTAYDCLQFDIAVSDNDDGQLGNTLGRALRDNGANYVFHLGPDA